MPQINQLGKEQRKYLRLDTVFPVEYKISHSDWLQGFTNNISKGGICLAVRNLPAVWAEILQAKHTQVALKIEIPITGKVITALAKPTWIKKVEGVQNNYLVGLSYEEIDPGLNRIIMRYAWTKKLFLPLALGTIFIFAVIIGINVYVNMKLIKGNKALVEQLVNIVQDSSIAKQKIKVINKEKEDLQLKIQSLGLQVQAANEQVKKTKRVNDLTALIQKLDKEKEAVQEQLMGLQQKESVITEDLLHIDKKKAVLQKANVENMYKWLKVHQNMRTGLVMSYEGDKEIEKWAFTYDQALVVIAYANFLDFTRAQKILDFYNSRAEKKDGLFLNAYYSDDGKPAEYIMHSGPNIWLGIAAMQYTKISKDEKYLSLAKEIAQEIIGIQARDPEGGICGGPGVTWFSTEHNLDAYAFFNMLYKYTTKAEYLVARDKALDWLVKNTYNGSDIPVKRGLGDATIATDTYAWSIAAIGPGKLQAQGLNPDKIMEFAEANCSKEVCYLRPDGNTVKIKGFDFASQKNIARGGVVSSEWTAQMILSLKIMSDFYYKKDMIAKARAYAFKADDYLSGLSSMIICSSSPSGQGESCLPYATADNVDTGHGWMTPKGTSTGSVSGTVYTIFAYYNFNPLELKD